MTTTTGDPSTLKTPASLSGGDLVSRLLAATPPYLYNVPLTPHSFFFSEMLRSFVQAKSEAGSSIPVPSPSIGRRRKRSWKEARDRPLELTTKDKPQHQINSTSIQEKYFHSDISENRYKSESFDDGKNPTTNFDEKNGHFGAEVLKSLDENRTDFSKHSRHFFDDSSRTLAEESITQQDIERKNYEERIKVGSEVNFMSESKNKIDFSTKNILSSVPTKLEDVQSKNFGIPNSLSANPEFIPNPLWYPPYPMHQSYPGIDPLHFFIDLRVSGHIWDRKINERQLPFKSKHCSAFSVPQSKEFNNRPLNLTRDEAGSSRKSDENAQGTNFILKNLTKTYKGIEKSFKKEQDNKDEEKKNQECDKSTKEDEKTPSESNSVNKNEKDLRALIGLELVVDYVKEPKEESIGQQSPQNLERE
ncbi:uncharacterized protein [Chelonus insularis]|uniref:uncharacterized protein n=1 Tax=Chelonus insularis TaxID=460826 RepID=UPI00158AE638|nr:uncharacterized protein LOC118073060 [Chelonus insularis]XP_034949245.1 uncharacterized protein LOC118073060 [Chelonus insularis]XP_034949246.1 uncharacterized protein LOC118073060 [Chelonus insularis]